MSPDDAARYLAHAIQLVLGVVFLLAAVPKIRRPRRFARTVAGYRLLSKSIAPLAARGLVAVESALAVTLLAGWLTAVAVPVATGMFLIFLAATTHTVRQGRRIPCGCFGDSGELVSPRTMVRLTVLSAVAMVLLMLRFIAHVPPLTAGDVVTSAYGVQMAMLAVFLLVLATWLLSLPELTFVLRGGPAHRSATRESSHPEVR